MKERTAGTDPPPPLRRGALLPRLSVRRPVAVGVAFCALLVLGTIAYRQIPIQLVPTGYELPFLYIWVPVVPANPKDLEERVAIPIEERLSTLRNLRRLRSRVRSSEVGFMVDFADGTDMIDAYNEVRDRLERATAELPDDVQRPFIWKFDPNDSPVYWFGVSVAVDAGSNAQVEAANDLLTRHVVRILERVEGVSRVEMMGSDQELVRIELDDTKVRAAGLSTVQLIEGLRDDNFTMSAGNLEHGGQTASVRVVARFDDLETMRELPVGNGHRLGDVAVVARAFEETERINRIDGRDAVVFGIYKDATANTVEVCAAVREALQGPIAADPALADFTVHEFHSQADLILESIGNLQSTAVFGGVFALVVLFAFLRRVRMTLVVTVAIPVSMLVTVIVMYFTGFTLNVLTLMGLMLSVGMVVDNSIVVVENVQRWRASGMDPATAAIHGAAEVALALLVATSTTVVVFLPMILMSGNESLSFYLGMIGYPVCVSLVASLGVSLAFVPLAARLGLSGGRREVTAPRLLLWLEALYHRSLAWTLRHRVDAAVIFAVAAATVVIPWERVKRTDQLEGQMGDFRVNFDLPTSMTFAERDAFFRSVEAVALPLRDRFPIQAVLTRSGDDRHRLQIFLRSGESTDAIREGLIAALDADLPEYPGVSWRFGWQRTGRGGEDASVTLKLRGPDSSRLAELSDELVRRVSTLPEVTSVEADLGDDGLDELHILVEREAAQTRGLSATVVGGAIDYALRGRRLPSLSWGGREIELRAVGDEALSQDLARVQALELPSARGPTPLGQITTARVARGYGSIRRENRATVLDVKVNTTEDDLEALGTRLDQVLAGFELPRGYSFGKGERFERLEQSENEQAFALILAVVFVFLLMGVLFESALMPLAIVFSIPFAFVGVYWALYLTDTAFDIMAGVGLVILVGVVVNNAIVLVDTINQQRSSQPIADAVVDGSVRRLRPVLMTALTTIFGLVPMSVGDAGIVGIPYAPLGRTVIGGLLASTLLTLFVVPYLYYVLNQARDRVLGSYRRATGRRVRSAAAAGDGRPDTVS